MMLFVNLPLSRHMKVVKKQVLKNSLSVLLGVSLMLTAASSVASDKAKEKRWEAQITDALMDGEAIKLSDGKEAFLALDMPAEEKSEIGVLVMHGIGIHPDWPQVVSPLRVGLSEAGWHTLSLQMPILGNEAKGEDYAPLMDEVGPRIEAGMQHLKKAGAKKVVLVSHSLGAQMTSYYLANRTVDEKDKNITPVVAYVAVGMSPRNSELLKKINVPVFDIYGSDDLEGVVKSAEDRAKASSTNKRYKQEKVEGANHFFDDKDDVLVEKVTQFIKEQ